jgi:serine/threonine protein kinase/DNA-binding winged helix-turn-helix (wHTH) protein
MVERLEGAASLAHGRVRRRWHFAGSALDERSLELVVNGVACELERKPLEVLLYLLQHAGEVCTKDELLEGIWPGRILSETVLTKCIGRLREVLGDRDQAVIKTAYGFGYRLVAAVRVETGSAPEPLRFDFRPGDHPPGRPLWSLVERLGLGGHCEVWRGRHEKTGEQRVFKFALDDTSLGALKREITLFRVINDTLAERARVVRILDWNLEQLPYFLETECVMGGSLVDWAKGRGGIGTVPLAERLELVAKVASAVAAVHSVGVLHKDLKPSNVLVKPMTGGAIDIVLGDFGSGGVLDPAHIERLGITRLGFTRTLAAAELSSATPMYLAPEILAGQPYTVKADLYALGVMLYQVLVGDLHRMMSPGWERDIADELLREDIALVAEGNPAVRLADAEVLARRLRTLGARRAELNVQRETQARAERAGRLLERSRARRFGLVIAFITLVLGLATSTVLYVEARRAQERSASAAAQSRAVVEFLSKDVFSPVSSGAESVNGMTVTTLLNRAGQEVDSRFAQQPQLASELHFVIGRSLNAFTESPLATAHFRRSLELGEALQGEGSESALRSASELVTIDYVLGELPRSIARYEEALEVGRDRLGARSGAVMDLRLRVARGHHLLGHWAQAQGEFAALLHDAHAERTLAPEFLGEIELYDGNLLIDLARPLEAQAQLTSAAGHLVSGLGAAHGLVADARAALGHALGDAGQYEQAMQQLEAAQLIATRWATPESWTEIRPRYFMALVDLQKDRPAFAEPILEDIVNYEDANKAAYLKAHQGYRVELDHTGAVRQALGEAYARQGRLPQAIAALERAVAVCDAAYGPKHPTAVSTRLSLAEALLSAAREPEARAIFEAPSGAPPVDLPAPHPILAQWYRVDGLLALQRGNLLRARQSLETTLKMYESLYGAHHWRTLRAREELSRVPG